MQYLLVPVFSNATEDEMNLVENEQDALLDLGFEVELGGPNQIKLVGAPIDLVESKAQEILSQCIYLFA